MAPSNLVVATLLLLLQAWPPPASPRNLWILECDMPGRDGLPGPRVFRLGQQRFEEWRPDEKRFGGNMCAVFPCRRDEGSYEGIISSASLILTVRASPETGLATWSTIGASGFKKTSGTCQIRPDTGAPGEGDNLGD